MIIFLSGFLKEKAHIVTISGLLLEQKAEDLARHFNIYDFKATNEWFDKWKVRNQIYF